MLSKLTINGLYSYARLNNDDLFEYLDLPTGLDKDCVIGEILRQASEFSLLYTDYEFMKLQIGVWSKKWKHNFERWVDVYNKQYEALYNVDVTTVIEEHGKNKEDESKAGNNSGSSNGTTSGNDTKSKAAYDASTFQNVERLDTSESSSLASSGSHSESMTASSSHDVTTTDIKRGNQGVTMSQELLLAEFNAWYWNLYQHIAEIFVSEYCITLYE